MPSVHPGESQDHYIHRAIPVLLNDNTAQSQRQAVAIAYSMWREHRRKQRGKKSFFVTKNAKGDEKPANCSCPDYPYRKLRNGSGHEPECPVHKEWLARGGFCQNRKNLGAVTPAMSSIDATLGGSFVPPPSAPGGRRFHWSAKPFHRRKLRRTPTADNSKRHFSQEQRDKLADSHAAMPDGSFPIVNRQDLENAIRAIGRASHPDAAKRHIKKRASALGLTSLLPDDWKDGKALPGDTIAARRQPRWPQSSVRQIDELLLRHEAPLVGGMDSPRSQVDRAILENPATNPNALVSGKPPWDEATRQAVDAELLRNPSAIGNVQRLLRRRGKGWQHQPRVPGGSAEGGRWTSERTRRHRSLLHLPPEFFAPKTETDTKSLPDWRGHWNELSQRRAGRFYCWEGKDYAGPNFALDLPFIGPPQYSEEEMSITFAFAASHGRDRVGDFLEVAGIDTTKHRKNPVAFLDHGKQPGEYSQPIGKCISPDGEYTVRIDPHQGLAIATVFLDRDPENKVARRVFSQFKQGIIRAGSIGYRPLNVPKRLPADPETGTPPGQLLDRVELLEVTLTALPANGDAVRA